MSINIFPYGTGFGERNHKKGQSSQTDIVQRKQPASQPKLWLSMGLVLFTLHFLYGLVSTFAVTHLGTWFLDWFSWAAASVIYFFFGALAGLLWSKQKLTDWAWGVLIFWLLADLAVYVLATPHQPYRMLLFLFFPLVYGSLFTPFAFSALLAKHASTAALAALAIAYLVVFWSWLALELRKPRWPVLRRVLLVVLLLVLLAGAVSCAARLNG